MMQVHNQFSFTHSSRSLPLKDSMLGILLKLAWLDEP
jgi:hypothetical protein